MKPLFKSALVGSVLFGLVAIAQAQPAGGPGGPGPEGDMRARMQAHMVQRAADLKSKLKLSPEQDTAWKTYMAAMKPPADLKRPQRGEMEKLSTPERLDKMRELRKQRDAEMDKHDEATRTFYATLTAEQKAVFDANTGERFHRRPPQEPRKP
jgi:Spy/CpxP family protein refolding chaperone